MAESILISNRVLCDDILFALDIQKLLCNWNIQMENVKKNGVYLVFEIAFKIPEWKKVKYIFCEKNFSVKDPQ